MQHSRYGGSTAARTWNCAGWRQLADTLPKGDSSSSFADAGTLCHNAMEAILGDEVEPLSVIGMTYKEQTLTEQVYHDKIIPALEAFEKICKDYGINEWECETSSMLATDVGGTADMIGAGETWTLILDWKFGSGVMVSPVESHQGLFYSTGGYHSDTVGDLFEGRDKVVIAIVQPGNHETGSDYGVWETTMDRVSDYKDQFLFKVRAAEATDPATCAGDWCKFCPASSICPQKTGAAARAMLMDPEDLESIRESLKLAKELETWIATVRDTAHSQLENGAAIAGWKLVNKVSNRAWVDPAKVVSYLARKLGGKKNVVKESPLSPAAIEKLAKSQDVELDLSKYTERHTTGTTLAPASDKRPAVLSGTAAAAALASLN